MKPSLTVILLNYRNYLKKIFPQSLSYILNGELYDLVKSEDSIW